MNAQLITEQSKSNTANAVHKNKQQPFFSPVVMQPKLTIGPVDDPYEREADAMADRVMRMSATDNDTVFFQPKPLPVNPIQRKCAACDEEEKLQRKENEEEEGHLQLKPVKDFDLQRKCADCEHDQKEKVQKKGESNAVGGMTAPSIVHDVINSTGQPLETGTRNFMESRFGYDFGNVQIHNDSLANKSSKDIDALAYTHGNHIAFANGKYQPNTDGGKKLLAHELAHVIQQENDKGFIQRYPVETKKDCPKKYEDHEIEQSGTEAGILKSDYVFSYDADEMIIADFGVDSKSPKKKSLKNPSLIKWLRETEADKSWQLMIHGFSDCVGSEKNNSELRRGRANKIKAALSGAMRARSIIVPNATSDEYIIDNMSIWNRAANRSVVIKRIRTSPKIAPSLSKPVSPVTSAPQPIITTGVASSISWIHPSSPAGSGRLGVSDPQPPDKIDRAFISAANGYRFANHAAATITSNDGSTINNITYDPLEISMGVTQIGPFRIKPQPYDTLSNKTRGSNNGVEYIEMFQVVGARTLFAEVAGQTAGKVVGGNYGLILGVPGAIVGWLVGGSVGKALAIKLTNFPPIWTKIHLRIYADGVVERKIITHSDFPSVTFYGLNNYDGGSKQYYLAFDSEQSSWQDNGWDSGNPWGISRP